MSTGREVAKTESFNEPSTRGTLEAHHDDIFFQTYPDVEAPERVISLIKFLEEKQPSDKVTVAELLKAAQIKQ